MKALPEMLVEVVADPLAGGPAGSADIGGAGVVVIAVHPADGSDQHAHADPEVVELLAGWGVDLPRRLNRTHASGARSEAAWIDLERDEPASVLALGMGTGSPAQVRRSAAAAVRRMRGTEEVLVLATRGLDEPALAAFAEGLYLGTPTPTWARTPPAAPPSRVRLAVADLAAGQRAIGAARAHAGATLTARVLIHTPSNVKSPAWVAEQAEQVAAGAGLSLRVRDEAALRAEGFGGLVAVGAGSVRPPRLVELSAGPSRRTASRHVVLVGKGITFDSGGLSLKPPDMQIPMKTDMSGAGVVLGVMARVADRLPAGVRVTGLLCLAENLPGAAATRPGDVVTHHGGLTSEVQNTDAEGRLVLGDGLDYAVRDLGADVVVDVATLTGAATLGLGRRHAALFSNTDVLARTLTEAGEAAGEQLWRMPLHADYAALIASDVADQANAGTRPGAGAITAALFLQRFVGDTPWAHLDIAGTGRSDAERDDLPKGGTGFGARALLRWIEAGAPA